MFSLILFSMSFFPPVAEVRTHIDFSVFCHSLSNEAPKNSSQLFTILRCRSALPEAVIKLQETVLNAGE